MAGRDRGNRHERIQSRFRFVGILTKPLSRHLERSEGSPLGFKNEILRAVYP